MGLVTLLLLPSLWRSKRFWPVVAAQALGFIIYLPWLPNFIKQIKSGDTTWIPKSDIVVLVRTVCDFLTSYERSTLEAGLALLIIICGFALGLAPLIRGTAKLSQKHIILGCWFILPLGAAFLISQPYVSVPLLSLVFGTERSVFLTRNLIVASFPLYLLLARSLTSGWRPLSRVLLVLLVVLSTVAYFGNNLTERKEDYRAAAQVVAANQTDTDLVVLSPYYLKLPFIYYLYPTKSDSNIKPIEATDNPYLTTQLARSYNSLSEALEHYRRVWLITNGDNIYRVDSSGTATTIAGRGSLIKSWNFQGVVVQLYDLSKTQ
jgi:hypothetical protein